MTIDNYTDRERAFQREIERLTAERDSLQAKYTEACQHVVKVECEHGTTLGELTELRAKLAALEKQEPVGEVDEDDSGLFVDLETPTGIVVKFGQKLYAAAGAAPVTEGWRSAVAMAYGHLWHVNNEPMAPTPLRSEESASYAARKLLRDLMTTKERGEAINAVQKLLAAAPKEPK